MKKPYQIEAQRAVRQLETMAADGNPAVQMVLPMAEMVGWLRQGVGALGNGDWEMGDIHDRYLSRRDADLLKPPGGRGLRGPHSRFVASELLRIRV